jgi:hypothetical protein
VTKQCHFYVVRQQLNLFPKPFQAHSKAKALATLSLYKLTGIDYILHMRKSIILLTVTLLVLMTVSQVAGSDIRIKKSDLYHFVGTYDAEQKTLVDFAVAPWDSTDPMGFHNAVSQFPDTKGVYFALSPWYIGLADAVLPFPAMNVMFVSLVDIKLSYSAHAIVTKWKVDGDNLEFMCVMENFPDLGGAPNLDGCYMFPDSSLFLIARSAGGGMESIWHRYSFVMEEPECQWLEIFHLESEHLLQEAEFTEKYCRLIDTVGSKYNLIVVNRYHHAKGEKRPDGSYLHEMVGSDTTTISLWERAQQIRKKR